VSQEVLRGCDHVRLGRVAAVAVGPAALALSRGGADKPYAYYQPNEDCTGFASGDGGTLIAVGDAHKGWEASHVAIDVLLQRHGAAWTAAAALGEPWPELAARAAAEVHAEVLRQGMARDGNPDSRTTLVFALVRPADDLVAWGSIGDSHVFVAGPDAAEEITGTPDPPRWFVGSAEREPGEIAERLRTGTRPRNEKRAVVLASDGLSELNIGVANPAAAVAEAVQRAAAAGPELRPLEAARGLVETAQEAHRANNAGDNMAAAVVWLD